MSLLFVDGFDHVDDAYELLKWDSYYSSGAFYYTAGVGRTGGWGMYMANNDLYYLDKILSSEPSTVITGLAIRTPGHAGEPCIDFRDSGTTQVHIRFGLDGMIKVYRGTATLVGSSAVGVFTPSAWFYFEIKIVFHATAGSIEVVVDEDTVINLTGIDTIATANAYCNQFRLRGCTTSSIYFDDLYICDTAGTKNNDFLGDVTITTLYPTSDGNSSDFTPSTGTDNYALVDEPQLLATTDYNESSTIGHKDLYGVTAYDGGSTICGVQVTAAVLNSDTGIMSVRPIVRSGGTPADNEGDSYTLSQTLKAAMHIFEQEPTDAVDWTTAKIDAAEFGVKVQA